LGSFYKNALYKFTVIIIAFTTFTSGWGRLGVWLRDRAWSPFHRYLAVQSSVRSGNSEAGVYSTVFSVCS